MKKKLKILVPLFLIGILGLYAFQKRQEQLNNPIITIGYLAEKHFNNNRGSIAEIRFQDRSKQYHELILRLSDQALKSIQIGYPFLVNYSKENPSVCTLNKYDFPPSLISIYNKSVPAKILSINKNSVYGLDLEFKGFWEVISEYSVNGIDYSTVTLLEQEPSFRIGQEFYARFNENHPDIGYLDLNSPFIIEDILNSIELLEDSLINLDTGSTQELDNIIIGGDSI
ncbi:MAG: hypothetical protein ACJASR_002617 [Psychroserpens sp.]|jgi:hypothetical protein